jgi:hypothetical protein
MTRQLHFEPELTAPTPRRVKYRDGPRAGCGLWFGRLFLLPHTLAGAFILVMAVATTVQYLRVLTFGVECDGRVVRKTETKGGKGTHYGVEYAYAVGGVEHAGRVTVNRNEYAEVTGGDPVAVRAVESAPEYDPWPRLPGQWAPARALGYWAIALFWNGIMSLFLWGAYVRPWRDRRLVRVGQPAAGVVRAVVTRNTRPRSYRVTYEYTVPDRFGLADAVRTGSMVTDRWDATRYLPGRPVTVLYDPDRPGRSVVYELTAYQAG